MATTIAKPNFQAAAHNIIKKGAFTQRHTRKSKLIAKARKPNHVFRSGVGLSAHINTLISHVWAYFDEFSRKRPPPVSDLFVVHKGGGRLRELIVAQLIEHCIGIAEVRESPFRPEFFRPFSLLLKQR